MIIFNQKISLSNKRNWPSGPCVRLCCVLIILVNTLSITHAKADNIEEALQRSYMYNPQLNAQRAGTRSVDENIAQARGSFMPTVTGQGNAGIMNQNLLSSVDSGTAFGGPAGIDQKTITNPVFASVVVSMNIFNGFRGVNGINQAEAQIHQSREQLRNTELSVLDSAASAYMTVLRDTAIFDIRCDYVKALEKQVSDNEERLKSGEDTRTDVFQAQTYLSRAKQDRVLAFTNLQASIAQYKQITGLRPKRMEPAKPIDRFLPKTLEAAIRKADADHPLISAARYNVHINEFAVKIAEGSLAPTVNLQSNFGQTWNFFGTAHQRLYQGSGSIQLNVPIYEGGITYSQIRQAKEKLGEAQLLYDQQVNVVHQQIEANWAAWLNAEKYLLAAKEQVKNAEATLAGIRVESKYGGYRETFTLLNYLQFVYEARIAFVAAQRERIVSSYNALAAIGQLSASTLNLDVPLYQVSDHYDRVKSQFIGVETWK